MGICIFCQSQLEAGAPPRLGQYSVQLLTDRVRFPRDRIAYVDAEDPNLSSWARYANNAPIDSPACNCVLKIDAHRSRA